MRRRFALVALLLQMVGLPVQARPTASMHWGTCPYPSPEDRNRGPSSKTTQTITIVGTGLTEPVRGIDLFFTISAGGSVVPDAWRVDPDGCAEKCLHHNNETNPVTCPLLRDPFAPGQLQVEYQTHPPGGWSQATEIISYHAEFDPMTTNVGTTYTILRLDFDLSSAIEGPTGSSGACGCLDRPLAIRLHNVFYRDAANVEHAFLVDYAECLHWNDPTNKLECPFACELAPGPCPFPYDTLCVATTPATQRSWGNVKASYR